MQVTITIDDQEDGVNAARIALSAPDFVLSIEEALSAIREKIKYGSNLDQSEVEHEAFTAGLDFARTALIEALEDRGLLDLVIY